MTLRRSAILLLALAALLGAGYAARAQSAPPAAVTTSRSAQAATAPVTGPATPPKAAAADSMMMEPTAVTLGGVEYAWQILTDGLADVGDNLLHAPARLAQIGRAYSASSLTFATLAGVAAMLAAAALIGWATHLLAMWATRRLRAPRSAAMPGRVQAAVLRAACDMAALIAFAAAARHLPPLLGMGDANAHAATQALVGAALASGRYVVLARFLFMPAVDGAPLFRVPRAERLSRLIMIFGGAVGLFLVFVAMLRGSGAIDAGAQGMLWVCVAGLNLFKAWVIWTSRKDLAAMVTTASEQPNLAVRAGALALPIVGVALPLGMIVLITIAHDLPNRDALYGAGMTTQSAYFMTPLAAGLMAGLAAHFAERRHSSSAYGRATRDVIVGLVGGAVTAAGLVIALRAWSNATGMASMRMSTIGEQVAMAAVVLIAAWALLRYCSAFFEHHSPVARSSAPDLGGDEESTPQSRLASALPLLRIATTIAIVTVAAMLTLSLLGLNIAPLVAGAGIFGLAVSFGSQALVRDIVSGIFFMADDAFRIGEYIDTGRLRGTVEKLSLRALQLRHQNGQLHTIPYGQLSYVSNFSRNWQTIKFNIRMDRATDIEAVRKRIKKTGEELLQDEEIAGDFLAPMKMQGVAEIADNALVIRIKFTVKPVRPSYVHRIALRRLYERLNEHGFKFATNLVTVNGPSAAPEAAAAAQALQQAQLAQQAVTAQARA